MTQHSCLRLQRSQRTPAEAAELSLIRTGRFVILVSLPVAMMHIDQFQFNWLATLMVATYVTFLIRYWTAIQTRQSEAVALAVIAVALAVLYIGAGLSLWGPLQDSGVTRTVYESGGLVPG